MMPKYRAWDTKRKKMWSAEEMGKDQLTLSPDGRGFVNVSGTSTRLSHYLPHLIPLQFTGRLDKNKKEIYEGDCFKRNGHIGWVEQAISGLWVIVFDDGKKIILVEDPAYAWKCEKEEVIGNVTENPELLEEK